MVLQILTTFIGLIGVLGFSNGILTDEEAYWESIQFLEQQMEVTNKGANC